MSFSQGSVLPVNNVNWARSPHKRAPPRVALAPRGATPHHLTADVWAQIGGKWVLFGPGGRETEYCYMGVF